jgi:TonB family protein
MATIALRQPNLHASDDRLFQRCLVGSAIAGGLFLVVVLLAPVRKHVVTSIEQLPERFAKLIIEKPAPPPVMPLPASDVVGGAGGGTPAGPGDNIEAPEGPVSKPPGPVSPTPQPRGGGAAAGPSRPGGGGAAGRARAQAAVTGQLAGSTALLEKSLEGLTSSLQASGPTATSPAPGRARRGRGMRAGRSDAQVGSGGTDIGTPMGAADLEGSAVASVAIGNLSPFNRPGTGEGGLGGGAGTGVGSGPGGTGSGPGVYRSNASLLAVIQRYAAGIQYCYGNELKRDPSLKGKLVVALTVSASGAVTEATIVEDTVRSPRLTSCALSQIREWKFPPIPYGSTAFQTPFVFTPPN